MRSAAADSACTMISAGLLLGLAYEGGRRLLGLWAIRAASSWALRSTCGALLAERGREAGLVDHRVRGPFFGLGQLAPQVLSRCSPAASSRATCSR